MTHHTTGPWEVRERDHVGDNIFSADNKRIANTFGPPDAPEFAANARLIAAAPEMAAEIARLRDLLDRISTEAPGAIPACNCGEGEACNRCEIRHLLDIYNGRVPDGPYRKPVVNAYEVAIKSRWPKAVAKQTRTGCWRITDGGCGGLSEDAPTIEAAWKSAVFKTSPLPPHEIKLQPAT